MKTYKIVYLKDTFMETASFYPQIGSLLYLNQNDLFETKQVELLFHSYHIFKDYLMKWLHSRDDYDYQNGIHILKNQLTEEEIEITIKHYNIEVKESQNKHIVFDALRNYSQNFYMINE